MARPVQDPVREWGWSELFAFLSSAGVACGGIFGKALLAFAKGVLEDRKRQALKKLRDKDPKNDAGAKLELTAIAGGEEALKEVEKKLGKE
jgi:hypothetical protein